MEIKYIELTNYKFIFLSPSSFSLYSICVNEDTILIDDKIIELRPNIFRDITYIPTVKKIKF